MRLIFLHGPPAAGKLTIGRIVAERTGFALFHNHLVVDAVAALFPFGSPEFVRLREHFWLEALSTAARSDRSLVFTFAPEASVAVDFPARAAELVDKAGGQTIFVALTVDPAEQERRIDHAERAAFGKLRSPDLLRTLRPSMAACEARMPAPGLVIDTTMMRPDAAADAIVATLDSLQ